MILIGILAIVGMLSGAVLQFLLLLKKVKYEHTIRWNLAIGALIGIWLLHNGYLFFLNDFFPTGLAVLGLTAGMSYILMSIGFLKGVEKNRLFIFSSVTVLIAYSVWAFWLGSLFLS